MPQIYPNKRIFSALERISLSLGGTTAISQLPGFFCLWCTNKILDKCRLFLKNTYAAFLAFGMPRCAIRFRIRAAICTSVFWVSNVFDLSLFPIIDLYRCMVFSTLARLP